MTSKLEHALSLAERGFYVFRIKKNGKRPFAEGWQSEATCNVNEVRDLFTGHDYNIGIYTGKYFQFAGSSNADRALIAVDIDTKDGKEGDTTMRGHDALGRDFPPTYTVTTASGGRHLIYATDTPLSGGANKLGMHVDIKSHGGYIVAQGSSIDGVLYLPADATAALSEAPQWLVEWCGQPMAKTSLSDIPDTAMDSEQAIKRTIAYLTDAAPPAISRAGGNQTTLDVSRACRDFGISQPLAEELMWEHYNPRCSPPWDWDEFKTVIANGYRYAKKAAGNLSPQNDFTPVALDPKEEEQEKKLGLFYEWCKDIDTDNDYYPLIEDLLDQGTMSVIYGDSNTGKTFAAMDLTFHIAMGKPWDNKKVTQGSVLYIAAEGGRGARNRIAAMRHKYDAPDAPFALVPCPINLYDRPKDVKSLIKLIQQAERERGPLRAVVVDTLARAMSTGNENAAEDMNRFVENCDAIRHITKAHLMIVHHSGKDTSKGARGSSVLRAATDTELEVAEKTITVKKQRDMEFAKPIGFELTPIDLGTNCYGKPITSCTLTLVDAAARQDFDNSSRMDHRDSIALAALKECKTGRQLRGFDAVVDQKTWAQCCKDFDITQIPGATAWPKSDGSFNQAFRRVRDRLVAFGRVEEVEEKQWALSK